MSKVIKTHEELLKLDGQKVTCNIEGNYIDDAMVRVEDGVVYLCQNFKDGKDCFDKGDYKYSWFTSDNGGIISETDIKLKPTGRNKKEIKEEKKTRENLKVGDILFFRHNRKQAVKILGICGLVYMVSSVNRFTCAWTDYTIEELKESFDLKTEEEVETIVINGKTYRKDEYEKAIQGLQPLN